MRLRPGELAGPAGLNASSLAALAAALNATGVAADWNATDIASSFNTSALASALNASALVLNATAFAAASAVRAAAARASAASGDLLDGATPSGLVSAGAMHAGLLRHLNSTASLAAFLHVAGAIAGPGHVAAGQGRVAGLLASVAGILAHAGVRNLPELQPGRQVSRVPPGPRRHHVPGPRGSPGVPRRDLGFGHGDSRARGHVSGRNLSRLLHIW